MVLVTVCGLIGTFVTMNLIYRWEDRKITRARQEIVELVQYLRLVEKETSLMPKIMPPKKDPWGEFYVLSRSEEDLAQISVVSKGPDRQLGTKDDIK